MSTKTRKRAPAKKPASRPAAPAKPGPTYVTIPADELVGIVTRLAREAGAEAFRAEAFRAARPPAPPLGGRAFEVADMQSADESPAPSSSRGAVTVARTGRPEPREAAPFLASHASDVAVELSDLQVLTVDLQVALFGAPLDRDAPVPDGEPKAATDGALSRMEDFVVHVRNALSAANADLRALRDRIGRV